MTIFEELRKDHEIQRSLLDQLEQTQGSSDDRRSLFRKLKSELEKHAAVEEKHFYSHLMSDDSGIDKARHSVAEHKELDDRIAVLEDMDYSNPQWLVQFKELKERVLHHLKEEEQEVFQVAGKVLDDDQKTDLSESYREDMEERRA